MRPLTFTHLQSFKQAGWRAGAGGGVWAAPRHGVQCGARAPRAARRGVRYADVAGIDHVKADIEAMMDAVLGRGGYSEMGVKPPRVRGAAACSTWLCEAGLAQAGLAGTRHVGLHAGNVQVLVS